MTTIELRTRLTFDQLLDSLHQLSPAELTRLSTYTNKLQQKHAPASTLDLVCEPVETTDEELLAYWEQLDVTDWTEPQQAARDRIISALKIPADKRPIQLGLSEGLIEISDDFDAPLPREIEDLFWGSETDAYGMSLPQNNEKYAII